jgi:hypothetical protein
MWSALQKTGATAAIWFGVGFVCFAVAIYGSETQRDVTLLFTFAILVASVFTLLLWFMPAIAEIVASREKAKRQPVDKLALLRDLLDDDELAAFKETLKQRVLDSVSAGDDGELPLDAATLEALAADDALTRASLHK